MRPALAIAFALALSTVVFVSDALAVEPGQDESRAGMCEHFDGLPFVFCVAMCEARECDRQPVGDDRCEILAKGFANVTNGAIAPCVPGAAPSSI
jgi:hypothetical protein